MVMHEGERQKKAMSRLNRQSPAQWVLCPLLSNPKCMHFAQWAVRKPCNTVKEQNLSLKTEVCLRLLSRALGLWIPAVQAGSLCRGTVSPALPLGCHMDCGQPCPYSPHASLRVQLTGTPALDLCIALHPNPWHGILRLSPLVYLSQTELENLFTQVRFRGKCRKTCPVLTGFIRTCAVCGGLPSQKKSLSAGFRDMQRSSSPPAEVFHLSAFILSPTQDFQRKALSSCLPH